MVCSTLGTLHLHCSPPCSQWRRTTHPAAWVGELWQHPRSWSAAAVAGSARLVLKRVLPTECHSYLCTENRGITVWGCSYMPARPCSKARPLGTGWLPFRSFGSCRAPFEYIIPLLNGLRISMYRAATVSNSLERHLSPILPRLLSIGRRTSGLAGAK